MIIQLDILGHFPYKERTLNVISTVRMTKRPDTVFETTDWCFYNVFAHKSYSDVNIFKFIV